jgi:S1-C subfamily serine protease
MSEVEPDPASQRPRPYRRWREWLVPRSVLGITSLLLAFAIGASLSGVVLYSYYEYRLTNTDRKINNYINGFDQRFKTASESIDAQKQNAQAAVQQELQPLRQFQAEGGTTVALAQQVGKSVWFVQTTDVNGAPAIGSAFVVQSDTKQSILVGSYSTVAASTHSPAPPIYMTKGTQKIQATLDNWVQNQDLAVFTLPVGNLTALPWVAQDAEPRGGDRTFVASGFGAGGASVTQGFVVDVSENAIQSDAAMNMEFQGGPLINSDGQVTGIASLSYAPFGFPSGNVPYAVPIRTACNQLLTCPPGNNSGGASQPHP